MRLLVTRPQPEADETADRLAALGHEAVVLPLSRIAALPLLQQDVAVDAGVASSVNSIRHAPQWLLHSLRDKPVHVVGEATARAARAAGLMVGRVAEGAESLSEMLAAGEKAGSRFAYLCGRVRLPVFQARMAAARLEVLPLEVYDTIAVDYTPEEVLPRIGAGIDGVLLYSSMAARAFSRLAAEPALAGRLKGATPYCLSGRIASELDAWPGVQAARRADEPSLFALLDKNG